MKKLLNILLGVLLVVTVAVMGYAVFAEHYDDASQYDASISLCLYWGYFLLVAAVALAVFGALYGIFKNPSSAKFVGAAVVLIAIIIGGAYFIAQSHDVKIADLATGGYFGGSETIITETCILVTYVAGAAAFLTALVTEVWRAFK